MRRFFVDRLAGNEKIVLITGKELHHLKNVLRLKKGDHIVVFDGSGREFLGSIENISKGEACIAIEKKVEVSRESPFEIILGQGIVKLQGGSFLGGKQGGGEIALPADRGDGHDEAGFHFPGLADGHGHRRAGAHAQEEALLAGQAPGGLEALFILHVHDLVGLGLVEDPRLIGLLHVLQALESVP